MRNTYTVRKMEEGKTIHVQVPGSKSITNRALLLAALSNRRCVLHGVLFSDDSRAFLESLVKLGFSIDIQESEKKVVIQGTGGKIPNRNAEINVRSAGTAARFLTVFLAFAGGSYTLNASEQMCRRPMKPILDILKKTGVIFEFLGEEDHFPFHMISSDLSVKEVTADTEVSSQFASALLMAGSLLQDGLYIHMKGSRAEGAYIRMTIAMMEQFGISLQKEKDGWKIPGKAEFGLSEYWIEPDVSGACYFYAMAPLLQADVTVSNVHQSSMQGDIQFLGLLENMGCRLEDTKEGITVFGKGLKGYPGLDVSMKDFSDQTMTLCALAPFAESATLIRNIGHIRFQESDRISAICTELGRMGVECEEVPEADGIRIYPGEIQQAVIETYEDHRMAMAFTLVGLKTGKIVIADPECCRKTFENYFELIEENLGNQCEK